MLTFLWLILSVLSLSTASGLASETSGDSDVYKGLIGSLRGVISEQQEFKNNLTAIKRAAEERCNEQMKTRPADGNKYCPSEFDDYGCWDHTVAGTVAYAPCPSWKFKNPGNAMGSRRCQSTGAWAPYPVSRARSTNLNFDHCGSEHDYWSRNSK